MDQLLPYYNEELKYLREAGAEFASKHEKIARLLHIEKDNCDDPHTERFIEAAAFLAARVHHELDAEFPLITESLLGVLYPHYLRPIPSFSIAQFELDPEQSSQPDVYSVPKGSVLHTKSSKGATRQFRTGYHTSLWPVQLTDAMFSFNMARADDIPGGKYGGFVKISIRRPQGKLSALDIQQLRFYVAEPEATVSALYEAIFNHASRVLIRPAGSSRASAVLPSSSLQQVGFGSDEGALPWPDRSFLGYRHLQEYFAFPNKYFFFDIAGLQEAIRKIPENRLEILILLEDIDARKENTAALERTIDSESLLLGCTPIVNLFQAPGEPITITHKRAEYRVIPDVNRQAELEVYSVDEVTSISKTSERPKEIQSFYAIRHHEHGQGPRRFWTSSRKASMHPDGADVYLSFVDLDFDPADPGFEAVSSRLTCLSRNYNGDLVIDPAWGELEMESGTLVRARCLSKPTKTIPAPSGGGLQWRLISHLALNHLSLVKGGRDALREILMLYKPGKEGAAERQIAGIRGLPASQPWRVFPPSMGLFSRWEST